MVPVSVRSPDDVLGNHISFVFAELPCNEPDPIGRLYQVHASMSRRKRDGDPEGADLVLKAAGRTPVTVQQILSRLMSSARAFNLVVSNIPGPSVPMYMLGCPLEAVYPVVPLADNHAVSVGMVTVGDQACFGVYADREAMPDVDMLAQDIDDAIAELLAGTEQITEPAGSLLAARARDDACRRARGVHDRRPRPSPPRPRRRASPARSRPPPSRRCERRRRRPARRPRPTGRPWRPRRPARDGAAGGSRCRGCSDIEHACARAGIGERQCDGRRACAGTRADSHVRLGRTCRRGLDVDA